jgi:sRNA-binding regulator protein Hfq
MITNKGKTIIAKYLIGQAPAYASFLAFGCGPKPLAASDSFDDYSAKKALDFEMFRSPIISRGYVTEDGVSKIVFTAELPTEERYEISEVGVYSAGSNPSANANDSRAVLSFVDTENWEYHDSVEATEIPLFREALEVDGEILVQKIIDAESDPPEVEDLKAFQALATNPTFSNPLRVEKYERPRFLNNGMFISGDISNLTKFATVVSATGDGTSVTYTTNAPHTLFVGQAVTITGMLPESFNDNGVAVSSIGSPFEFTLTKSVSGESTQGGQVETRRLVVNPGSNHIHLAGTSVNFNKNAPTDELRLAFSLISKDITAEILPTRVRLLVEFATVDSAVDGEKAFFEVDLENGEAGQENGQHDFSSNRYVVVKTQLQELAKTGGFNWGDIQIVKIFASVIVDDQPSDDFYICLDALRLENLTTENPLYGLTGYSVVKNLEAQPIIKEVNTSNLAEFRFAIEVD